MCALISKGFKSELSNPLFYLFGQPEGEKRQFYTNLKLFIRLAFSLLHLEPSEQLM